MTIWTKDNKGRVRRLGVKSKRKWSKDEDSV
jgi:hypothetical protein